MLFSLGTWVAYKVCKMSSPNTYGLTTVYCKTTAVYMGQMWYFVLVSLSSLIYFNVFFVHNKR
jgi:hypothetical protein